MVGVVTVHWWKIPRSNSSIPRTREAAASKQSAWLATLKNCPVLQLICPVHELLVKACISVTIRSKPAAGTLLLVQSVPLPAATGVLRRARRTWLLCRVAHAARAACQRHHRLAAAVARLAANPAVFFCSPVASATARDAAQRARLQAAVAPAPSAPSSPSAACVAGAAPAPALSSASMTTTTTTTTT